MTQRMAQNRLTYRVEGGEVNRYGPYVFRGRSVVILGAWHSFEMFTLYRALLSQMKTSIDFDR